MRETDIKGKNRKKEYGKYINVPMSHDQDSLTETYSVCIKTPCFEANKSVF